MPKAYADHPQAGGAVAADIVDDASRFADVDGVKSSFDDAISQADPKVNHETFQ